MFLLILAYIFMYLVVWTHLPMTMALAAAEWTILVLFWFDIIMEIYHKSFEDLRFTSRFQFRFYLRTIVLMLLLVDEFLVLTAQNMPVRPFLILRCRTYFEIQFSPFFTTQM
jgi:hypothetical protein